MLSDHGHGRTYTGRRLRLPSAAALLSVTVLARPSAAREPECVLDSECARGRCIDLLCVDELGAPGAPAPARSEEPEEALAPDRGLAPAPEPARTSPSDSGAVEDVPPAVKLRRRPAKRAFPATADTTEAEPEPEWKRDAEADEPSAGLRQKVWYGGPLIGTYLGTAVVGALAIGSESGELAFAALFSSPIVHWANGKLGKGFLSLLMQPVAAGIGAFAAESGQDREYLTGAALGLLAWGALDVAAIAYKDPPKPEPLSAWVGPLRTPGGGGLQVIGAW